MLQQIRQKWMVFTPGLFFIVLGIVTVLAPKFILAVVASLFVFIGFVFSLLAWKFYQFRKNASKIMKNFGGAQVYSVELGRQQFSKEDEDEDVVVIH